MNHKIDTIRKLNDNFRTTLSGGAVVITSGVKAMKATHRNLALFMLIGFNDFNPENDPHSEHDFGAINIAGEKLFWKIDYYALDMLHGSENPADPAITKRVLTLMLASEY